ncbi:MAG: TauD/TfdA family dioxygenase [Rhodospirillales bacterium]|nr:TauD/TfdA family dioxygenase [Rhodospirillales bacterium]
MSIKVERLGKTFFARIDGVDIGSPLDAETISAIHEAQLEHGVLLFRGQHIDDDQQQAFTAQFGPIEPNLRSDIEFIAPLGNIDKEGNFRDPDGTNASFLRSNQQWHSDSQFFKVPSALSFLRAVSMPKEGGATQYADTKAAWDALPLERQAELQDLVALNDLQNSRGKEGHTLAPEDRERWPIIEHPVARIHEETGARALYIGSQVTSISGVDDEESQALIKELFAHSTQDQFIYTHEWEVGDLVIWDNRRCLHRGRPWDEANEARDVRRTTTAGTGPTTENGKPVDEYARAQAA